VCGISTVEHKYEAKVQDRNSNLEIVHNCTSYIITIVFIVVIVVIVLTLV
jgi:hypothetical protein